MKEKWKNLSIALIIALIVTGIWVVSIYYNILKPMNEINEEMESTGASGSPPDFVDDIEEQMYQDVFSQIIAFLIVVFCITTVLSYFVIERLRKRKNKKVN